MRDLGWIEPDEQENNAQKEESKGCPQRIFLAGKEVGKRPHKLCN